MQETQNNKKVKTVARIRDVGSQATPEVIQTWVDVYRAFMDCTGERKARLQEVAKRLGVTLKVAKRRLRNYEAMQKVGKKQPAPVRTG